MKIYEIQSETNPKIKYKIRRFDNGIFICECKFQSWERIRGRATECKHIKKVKKSLKEK